MWGSLTLAPILHSLQAIFHSIQTFSLSLLKTLSWTWCGVLCSGCHQDHWQDTAWCGEPPEGGSRGWDHETSWASQYHPTVSGRCYTMLHCVVVVGPNGDIPRSNIPCLIPWKFMRNPTVQEVVLEVTCLYLHNRQVPFAEWASSMASNRKSCWGASCFEMSTHTLNHWWMNEPSNFRMFVPLLSNSLLLDPSLVPSTSPPPPPKNSSGGSGLGTRLVRSMMLHFNLLNTAAD